jgi:hypothetical protein
MALLSGTPLIDRGLTPHRRPHQPPTPQSVPRTHTTAAPCLNIELFKVAGTDEVGAARGQITSLPPNLHKRARRYSPRVHLIVVLSHDGPGGGLHAMRTPHKNEEFGLELLAQSHTEQKQNSAESFAESSVNTKPRCRVCGSTRW